MSDPDRHSQDSDTGSNAGAADKALPLSEDMADLASFLKNALSDIRAEHVRLMGEQERARESRSQMRSFVNHTYALQLCSFLILDEMAAGNMESARATLRKYKDILDQQGETFSALQAFYEASAGKVDHG